MPLVIILISCGGDASNEISSQPSIKEPPVNPSFANAIDLGKVENPELTEISGVVMSRKNENVLWVHNDSGDTARLFAIRSTGEMLTEFYLPNISARDWEDIAIGPGPIQNTDYLYIGDIGDRTNAVHTSSVIYRMVEPEVGQVSLGISLPSGTVDPIVYTYPDGPRDAETVLIDPRSKDVFIISKWENAVGIYRLAYPQNIGWHNTTVAEKVGQIYNMSFAVGGDIGRYGQQIVIKTYSNVYYWPRFAGQTIAQALLQDPMTLPYQAEPQGEAIGWAKDMSGYYTISEERNGSQTHVFFYPRLP